MVENLSGIREMAKAGITSREVKKKEIYDYNADHVVYGMGWSIREDKPFRLALGSFIEEYKNVVDIVQLKVSSLAQRISR